jgi:hypothetical protein
MGEKTVRRAKENNVQSLVKEANVKKLHKSNYTTFWKRQHHWKHHRTCKERVEVCEEEHRGFPGYVDIVCDIVP